MPMARTRAAARLAPRVTGGDQCDYCDEFDGDEVVDNLWLAADLVATLGKGEEGRTDGPLENENLISLF